jgi:hypothetical protein
MSAPTITPDTDLDNILATLLKKLDELGQQLDDQKASLEDIYERLLQLDTSETPWDN